MNLELGDVIQLSDGIDYAIIQKIESNKIVYLYLLSTTKPLQTIIVRQKNDEDEIVLESIHNKEELDYILYKIGQMA